ncbi:centromere protein P isoform X1 [Pelodiscus sinensis]|uniref:centromere protein P isoform X1 n=1 Tax=Pelodiscus sinensis TaxID=13735 RepID=UPI0003C4633F|nr:centromere protein P isoform X1 [Pelodiscus sinensis]XP_025042749.1 centromere protein P isoform X1 [Pelodiscus sinensis]|eukprot:XP_006127626.1 centromere protein P isoform X1 [Pelodiscus sinensis]
MENDIYQVYEDEIHSLEEEIEMLTQKFENNEQESTFYSDEEIQVSGKSHQGDSKWHESPPDLKPELECLKSDLSFLMKFTGIWFTNYSKETVEKTGNKIIQKHRLSGNCCSLPFQMEFQLLEIQDDESIPAVVTDLSIIMECGEYSDLSKFVSCAEEQGSLLQFFRSLSFFAEWYEHRKCTFQHFKAKYPDIVRLPAGSSGDYLVIRSHELSGFELIIVWKIYVDEEGRVTPVLDLLPRIPAQALEDKVTTVENGPQCFRSMLHLLGIEASIENLIQSVSMEK